MLNKYYLLTALGLLSALLLLGCGNPVKRQPRNVFPGSPEYQTRVNAFKITPSQAYDIAHEKASEEKKMQFLSRKPTVITGRWYVFSMPQSSGAIINGYHVNGDNGEVKFISEKRVVTQK